jgi:hypothetical protein
MRRPALLSAPSRNKCKLRRTEDSALRRHRPLLGMDHVSLPIEPRIYSSYQILLCGCAALNSISG